jgi:hypothetical protein
VNAVDLAWKLMIGPAHIGGFRRATASREEMLKAIRATLHMWTGNDRRSAARPDWWQ